MRRDFPLRALVAIAQVHAFQLPLDAGAWFSGAQLRRDGLPRGSFLAGGRQGQGLAFLPLVSDFLGAGDEVPLRDLVLDAFDHALDGADVVGFLFVVAEAHEPPPVLRVLVALHYSVVEGFVERFHGFPFVRLNEHGAVGSVVASVVEDAEAERGDGGVVRVRIYHAVALVFGVGVEEGKV